MNIVLFSAYTADPQEQLVLALRIAHSMQYKPQRALISGQHRKKGRNNRGVITSDHRGGGHKRLYRYVDFQRNKYKVFGRILSIEYDPNRNARICLTYYTDGEKRYTIHARTVKIGDQILSSPDAPILAGNALPLSNIPLGTFVHNIELQAKRGGQVARSAGAVAQIVAKEGRLATLRLPSGEVRLVPQECLATIGQVGNVEANNQSMRKAGSKRWLGKRPKVRGMVMNAADHPHGGGEGRAPIGRKRPLTPSGRPTLGRKTRSHHRYSEAMILRRRKHA